MIQKGILWEQEYFCQWQISRLSSQESEKPNTRHRINVTVTKIEFVAGKYRDTALKYLYYEAQNLMCRRR